MFSDCEITKDTSRAKKFFENIISYTVGPYTLSDIIENKKDSINLIDVREYNDYLEGHIPYSMHIPYKEMNDNISLLDKNKVTVIYSYSDSCPRAFNTALELLTRHFPSVTLRGGYREWKKCNLEIIKSDTSDYPEHD